MGNFGKRILIIFICVVALVTFTLLGNAYQQSEKIHKVSDASQVVYEGNYNGVSYSVTRGDLFNTALGSNAIGTVEDYFLQEVLLKSVIESITDETLIQDEINYLMHGTSDATELEKAKAQDLDAYNKQEESFEEQLTLLGTTKEDYAKYMLAKKAYAKYRVEAGLEVSGTKYQIEEDDLKDEYKEGYKDTQAIVIKFYSSDDFTTYLKQLNKARSLRLTVVNDEIRVFIGDSKYMLAVDSDGKYVVNNTLSLTVVDELSTVKNTEYQTFDYEDSEGNPAFRYVPFAASLNKDADDNYIWYETEDQEFAGFEHTSTTSTAKYIYRWNSTENEWQYGCVAKYTEVGTGETDPETGEEITEMKWVTQTSVSWSCYNECYTTWDEDTTYTTSNTAPLTPDQMLELYAYIYNDVYSKQKEALNVNVTSSSITSAYADKQDDLVAGLKAIGYALVEGEVRKYVGNSEYVVALDENGVAKSLNGKAIYKEYETGKYIPNYEIDADESGNPVLNNEKIVYILDENGERVFKGHKIDEEGLEFTKANTIECTKAELYSVYVQLVSKDKLVYNYEATIEDLSDSDNRYAFATELFDTLSAEEYYSSAKSISSGTPYYMIYKLSSSVLEDELEVDSTLYTEMYNEKLDELLNNSTFVSACIAELFKEAGLQFFDAYLAYDYENAIKYDSSSNTYGPSDTTDYYKAKGYNANKLARLTKKVSFTTTKGEETIAHFTEKDTLTADKYYDFAMARSAAVYTVNAALDKVLVNMPENEKIHGTYKDYLLSDNWRVQKYVDSSEQINMYYEYGYYSYYGYEFDSITQALYGLYGVKNFDQLIGTYTKNTNRLLLIYKALVGELNTTTAQSLLNEVTFSQTKFADLYDNYMDIDINHILVYLDLDENDSPDDYTEFLASMEGDKVSANGLTLANWNDVLDRLYSDIMAYIYKDATLSGSSATVLSNYVSEFESSTRLESDDEYKALYTELKKLGVHLKYEEVNTTNDNEDNYVPEWRVAARALNERLVNVDYELTGYTIANDFTKTVYGAHFMVALAGDSFEKPSFYFNDYGFNAGYTNQNEALTQEQLVLYIQAQIYSTLFGTSGKCEEYAALAGYEGFEYPMCPQDLSTSIDGLYGDYISTILDNSSAYFSTYLLLKTLPETATVNGSTVNFAQVKAVYEKELFD